jgi:DNA-binding response OmpR family regulator
LSKKLSGVVKFETQDDLVVAYHRSLSLGLAQLRTPRRVQPGDHLVLRVEVANPKRTLDVQVTVEHCDPAEPPAGNFKTRVRLEPEVMATIEHFILAGDVPPEPNQVSIYPRPPLVVVVIDDSKLQAELAARIFRERGDTVLLAEDGLGGLALCLKHNPDVILSDVQMPKVDGWQLLRMLRARKQLASIPVIFLTTLGSERDRLLGYRLGVDDYLQKPYATESLIASVDRVVRSRKVAAPSSPTEALRGQLEQVSLPALLSFLELEQQSGTIVLEPKGTTLTLRAGRPIRARIGERDSQTGDEDVIFDLLDMSKGRFEFRPSQVEAQDSIGLPVSAILMEHARRSDEASRVEPTPAFVLDDDFLMEDPRCA